MFFSLWPCRLQARYHLCAAGWLDGERVGYPTAFSSPNCGSGYVGIVDYGRRVNLSETWDVFCYREKGKRVPCCVPLCKGEQQPAFRFLWSATGCQITLQVTLSPFNFKKKICYLQVVFQARDRLKPSSKGRLPTRLSVFVPSRGELHLQAGLRGGRLLLQRELAASPDVLPNADKLLVGTAHSWQRCSIGCAERSRLCHQVVSQCLLC